MADEVNAAAGATAPTVEALQAQVIDLQKQLEGTKDDASISANALQAANAENDARTASLKVANDKVAALEATDRDRKVGVEDLSVRARALVADYDRAMETNSPRTMAELNELKALLLGE